MKRKSKKVTSIILTSVLGLTMLMGCSGGDKAEGQSSDAGSNKGSGTTLELMTTWNSDKLNVMNDVLTQFTKETGIKVEVVTPGDEYETVMKTRMASQDLPDVFETHGWSVARYSEYLMPLNEESWASRIDEAILPVISDKNDNIYVAPITMGINTISYSKDAFEAADVNAGEIRTWAQFAAACEKLKEAGITSMYIGNKDGGTAQLAEAMPPTFLSNEGISDNQSKALKDGSFNFDEKWTPIAQLISGWNDKGYFNVDLLTADNESGTKELGQGKAAMMFGGSNNITQALTFSPDAKLGILAVPALNENEKSSLSMGEGLCFGVWKDSKHKEEAKQLLDYLTQADAASELTTASGDLPGFTDVENSEDYITKAFRETQKTFGDNLIYVPLFDREYMPSGMWDDLTNSFTEIFTKPGADGVKASVEVVKEAYEQKINQ